MTVEIAYELVFAVSVLASAAVLLGAATERVGSQTIIGVGAAIGLAAATAWVAFALDPSTELAVSATGLVACALASVGALALRKGLARGREIDRELAAMKEKLDAVVEGELRDRAAELERAIARARADSLSAFAEEERRRTEAQRELASEQERRARAQLGEALGKIQAQVEQRLAAWRRDLERMQQGLADQVDGLAQQQGQLVKAAEGKLRGDIERLEATGEEQRTTLARLRDELERTAKEAAAVASAELDSHAAERRRALHEVGERLRARERELIQRIEREEADATRRIQATFADVERRQVEQLKRVLDRASGRYAEAANHQFEGAAKTAREEAARRLARELDRAVQSFAREGESLLAERLAQLGDTGAVRLEKKLAQVAAGFDRQREEFVASLGRRLADVETELRNRLAALVAEEQAERVAIEGRLAQLSRRIDQTVSRAEERLGSLPGVHG